MKQLSLLMFVGILISASCNGQSNIRYGNPCDMNRNETYYLILLGGQSNMVGQGKLEDIKGEYHFENIWYYNFGMNPRLEIQNNEFGPEFGISMELEKNFPKKKFILLKYAIGGASMLDWAPDYDIKRAEITGQTSGHLSFLSGKI